MMKDFVHWNLSQAGLKMRRADVFVVSFPKSGRTWLRVFYLAYLAKVSAREFSLNADFPSFPKVIFTHDRWEHRLMPGWWQFIRGRHLVPPSARREKKIVLMVRDPRDVAVSLYFHLSKRPHVFEWTPQPMSEMVRHPKFGMPHIVELMNRWLSEWHGSPGFKLLRYEDCRADAARELRGLLEFLGLGPVNEAAVAHALEFSRFDNMRAMEASGEFREADLSPGNHADKDSFKARRGKVGGFHDYFTPDDLDFAAAELRKLDPRFGYFA